MENYVIIQIDEEKKELKPIDFTHAETEKEAIEEMKDMIKDKHENVYWELHRLEKITDMERNDIAS